jgi:hypothetical protein
VYLPGTCIHHLKLGSTVAPAREMKMSNTIPRQVSVTRDGKNYRGTYRLEGDLVTVRHTAADGVIKKMSMPIDGQEAIAVVRTVLRELA